MGKQGPCCHCGVTSTPLWRNGPPEKPVLCNACGSRWRTKGTLVNYAPIHARAFTSHDFENSRTAREGNLPPSKKSKSWYTNIHNEGRMDDEQLFAAYHPNRTCCEDDTSNKSSSGSAASVSESCLQFGSTDANEISGPSQSSFCDIQIPSKKRTRIRRHIPSHIEKFRQDLVTILHQQDSSYLSEFSEEALLFEGEDFSFNSETGHGSVLLRVPISSKEESVASSHIIGNKVSHLDGTYMGSSCCSIQSENNEILSLQSGNYQLVQDTRDTKKLIDNPTKQFASKKKSLEGKLSGDPNVLRSKCSSQKSSSPNESSNSTKEVSSLTSDGTGSGSSMLAKRPRDSPYIHTFEGTGA